MDTEKRGTGSPATLGAFISLVVIAGVNAPAIRHVSCDTCELDPFWAAALRFLAASLLLFLTTRLLRVPLPRGRALMGAVIFGTLQFGLGFGLIYYGLVHVPAGMGQVLIACTPLATLGLAIAQREETFRWDRVIGGVIALTGIAIVFSAGLGAGLPVGSMVALLAAALCWAEAFVVVRLFPTVHPLAMNAVAMGVGGLGLLATAALLNESFQFPKEAETWWAMAYLVIAGSIGVFSLYVFVLRKWSASAAAYQLVLIPLVTVPVSALLQDEKITLAFVIGSCLVLLGVYTGALRRPQEQAS